MDLDDLLTRSAPSTTPRTPELEHALNVLVNQTESVNRPPGRARRLALVSAAACGILGLGTAGATAAGVLPAWVPWSTDGGGSCEMQFGVTPAGPDGEPLSRSYTVAEKQRAVTEATRFLASYDYSSIDESDAIADWQKREAAVIASQPDPDERQPRLHGDDLALTAVGSVVWRDLTTDFHEKGLPTELVVSVQGWRCS